MARPKGSPNKATADVRKAIALLAERNVPKLEKWLTRTAKDEPARAAEILLRALEYHIPKLAKTEVAGEGGGPVVVEVVNYGSKNQAAQRLHAEELSAPAVGLPG